MTKAVDQFGNYRPGLESAGATLTGASSTSEQQVFFVPGDPNGNTVATRPAIAYDDAGGEYRKTGAGTNATGWETRVAPAE